MATTYLRLFDPTQQFQLKSGAINTAGLLRVYLNGTDDLADIYDENGTQLAQPAVLDNNGRALGLFVDSKKTYRLEVYDQFDSLLFTVRNMTPCGGGGGSSLGSQYDLVSTDGSVSIDKSVDGGRTTFDLSADKGSPEVIVTSSGERTTDGAFRFSAPTSHSGTKLTVDDGTVLSDRQFIHFEATVRLVWSSQQNAEADIQFRCMDTVESVRFDLSFPHTEFLDVSADYEVTADGTAIPVTVSGLPTGLSATVENFSVHAITKRYGEGSEYRAGNGILIQTGEISIDPTVVQEKLEAGANISIVGNTISATAEPQQPADWAATEGVTRILNKPDLDVYATHSEVTYGLAQKQDTISDLATIRSGAAAGATAVQPSEMSSALAGKQDVISDLSTIRSGAAKGATSVQPADLTPYAVASDVESALAGKQDVISDLSTIRTGAQAGATAVQPATMNAALAGKQDVINDLATIRAGASAGSTAVQPATMNAALAGKQDVIPDLATIRSGAAAGATAVQPDDLAPVATSGSYDDLTDKPSIPSFTQAQQAAIDSGIDATKVGLYDTHVGDMDIHVTPADKTTWNGKQDVISDLSTIRSGAAAGATAVQPSEMASALADKQDVIADLSDIRSGAAAGETAVQPADMASALADKQDVISDLATIRSGAAAGATAVQDPDYVHTDENFTSAEKTKLAGIEAGAQVNVNADWNAASGTDAYIANKPQNLVQDANYVHTDENFTSSDKSKLAGIEAGAEVNVKPDWNAAAGSDDEILNKPAIPGGTQLVPASTSSDADKVLTVDAQGVPGWANAQAPISAGSGIDITNNTVSAKVDGSTIGTNANGELESLVTQTNADWDAVSGASEILNKPVPKTLTAGAGISITENQSTITITNTLAAAIAAIGTWTDVTSEITASQTIITGGSMTFRYNAALRLISMIGEIHVQGEGVVYTLPAKYRPQSNFTVANPGATSYIDYTASTGSFTARSGANGYFSWTMNLPCLGE